jgi:hypothetical protein
MAILLVPETYATIQAGVNAASSTDEVSILAGVYTETDIKRVVSDITLKARGGRVVIDMAGAGDVAAIEPYIDWTLEGFHFKNGEGTGTAVVNGNGSTRDFDVVDCWFENCDYRCIDSTDNNGLVDRCIFFDCSGAGVHAGTKSTNIQECLAYNMGDTAFRSAAGGVVQHCTVADGTGGSYGIYATTVRNCIVANCATTLAGIRAVTTYDNCCAYNNTTADFYAAPDAESITTDPVFEVSAYTLNRTSSPCAGAGAVAATSTLDLLGLPRQSPPAMGCYEVSQIAATWPSTPALNKIRVRLQDSDTWPLLAERFRNWAITQPAGEVPICICAASRENGNQDLILVLDKRLVPGQTYTLSTSELTDGPYTVDPMPVVVMEAEAGGDVTALTRFRDLKQHLLDVNNGLYATDGGDYKVAGELDTLRKVIWTMVTTPRGVLHWAPQFGTTVVWKMPMPNRGEAERILTAQLKALPFVTDATARITIQNNHVKVSLDVQSSLGRITDEQEVV